MAKGARNRIAARWAARVPRVVGINDTISLWKSVANGQPVSELSVLSMIEYAADEDQRERNVIRDTHKANMYHLYREGLLVKAGAGDCTAYALLDVAPTVTVSMDSTIALWRRVAGTSPASATEVIASVEFDADATEFERDQIVAAHMTNIRALAQTKRLICCGTVVASLFETRKLHRLADSDWDAHFERLRVEDAEVATC